MTIEAPRSWLPHMELALPPGYYLERDPDLLILKEGREDRFVAAFSARGAIPSEVARVAKDDYSARVVYSQKFAEWCQKTSSD
ncbi:MAG: hypothetical protein LC781_17445 [Actinobacteria bacterium]|nr:hypothetical protein [Actinomycetota bacterium]